MSSSASVRITVCHAGVTNIITPGPPNGTNAVMLCEHSDPGLLQENVTTMGHQEDVWVAGAVTAQVGLLGDLHNGCQK